MRNNLRRIGDTLWCVWLMAVCLVYILVISVWFCFWFIADRAENEKMQKWLQSVGKSIGGIFHWLTCGQLFEDEETAGENAAIAGTIGPPGQGAARQDEGMSVDEALHGPQRVRVTYGTGPKPPERPARPKDVESLRDTFGTIFLRRGTREEPDEASDPCVTGPVALSFAHGGRAYTEMSDDADDVRRSETADSRAWNEALEAKSKGVPFSGVHVWEKHNGRLVYQGDVDQRDRAA